MINTALIGLPNSGKSSLFNRLTNNRQRVANFPGITVEKKLGFFKSNDQEHQVVDLPGIYTLDISTLDEKITRDYIFDKVDKSSATDIFILVMDATNLKKSLYLALQLKEIGKNFIVALNMIDLSRDRDQKLDLEKLTSCLGGVTIIPTSAKTGEGFDELLQVINNPSQTDMKSDLIIPKDFQKQIKETNYIKNKLSEVNRILDEIIINKIKTDTFTHSLDRIVLHEVWGPAILFILLILVFQLLFAWSDPFMGWIEMGFEWLGAMALQFIPVGLFQSLVVDGVIAGVGGIMVFLPHIIFLFIIIYTLEDFGYLGRAAFLLDFIMRKLGLPGKAVVPLLSSHACAIPGIMSARIIKDPTERMITMMISPLMACSARLPVYTLLIAVLIPDKKVFGFLGAPGLTLFGLYLFGIISAFVVAFISKKTFAPQSPSFLMMELPPYRVPKLANILRGAFQKGWIFVKKAGTVILVLSVIIWGLVTFPNAPVDADKPAIHYSYAASIGQTFEPIFRPLGFDWKITTALIPSFAAREVLVAAMGTVYAVEGDDVEDTGFIGELSSILGKEYSFATLMSLLIWFVFSPQCIATFGVMRKETNSYKMPIIFGAYTLVLAYIFSFLTFIIFS